MTAEELANFLTRVGGGQKTAWKFTDLINGTLRRWVFRQDDYFIFTRAGANQLLLRVRDSVPPCINVLGEPELLLTYGPVAIQGSPFAAGYAVQAYGRTMAFGDNGIRMSYRSLYLGPPRHGPDEGGEGDPIIPPP